MKIKNNIPNFITLLNLVSGSAAIILVFSGDMILASWFIFLAAVFDFFDGFAARILHAKSEIGAQLDSLADIISFGLAPSVIMYQLVLHSLNLHSTVLSGMAWVPFVSLFIAVAGAYRLAKFNTDPGQSEVFKGLPIPATGLFVAALPLMINQYAEASQVSAMLNSIFILIAIILFLSWLMVSNVPMISLKFKNFSWRDNSYRFILMGAVPVLFLFFRFAAIPMIIFLYIIISVITLPKKSRTH